MRKLKYIIATSIDGYIARNDGTFEGFLMQGDHVADFLEAQKTFDTVLMGRKTYEVGLQYGVKSPYPFLKQYVFSKSYGETPHSEINLVSDDPSHFVRKLKQQSGGDIWLCGGSELATALMESDLIDEITLKVNPVLFGTGIPVFGEAINTKALELLKHKVYPNGVVLLTYKGKN